MRACTCKSTHRRRFPSRNNISLIFHTYTKSASQRFRKWVDYTMRERNFTFFSNPKILITLTLEIRSLEILSFLKRKNKNYKKNIETEIILLIIKIVISWKFTHIYIFNINFHFVRQLTHFFHTMKSHLWTQPSASNKGKVNDRSLT